MDLWRQIDVVDAEEIPPITMVGIGGIGSFTVMALGKMGAQKITVYDPDKLEEHNCPNQLYKVHQCASQWPKVEALKVLIRDFTGVDIKCMQERFPGVLSPDGIVISGVDSMAARKEIWKAVKGRPEVPLYIEARMGAEVARIHSINPCDEEAIKWYEGTLYSDEEAVEAPCTARAIAYTGFMIGALIANQVKKATMKEELCKEVILDMVTLTLMTQ
jgi:hypothetical protein